MIATYAGENKEFARQWFSGELDLELTPQGTFSEKMRAGGAGIPAFFTPTGYKTLVHEGGMPIRWGKNGEIEIKSKPREMRIFNGKPYIMEEAITGDFALVRAYKADELGNLVFNKSAGNFSAVMCKAAKITICEVEEIVPVGALRPDEIHVPAIYVNRIVKTRLEKRIEKLTLKQPGGVKMNNSSDVMRHKIAKRVVCEFKDNMNVNLGNFRLNLI